MSRYNGRPYERALFLHARAFELGGGRRARARAVLHWTAARASAVELSMVRASLVVVAGQGRGLQAQTMTAWARDAMTMTRHRALISARDRLYHLRQARACGLVRCRVPS